ncbi:phage tail spike protein [Bacillus sp. GM_Baccil_2]|uniref:phage tail spike protein n=1 Tax=Bacillus sp. GM_Baccil_2 TaxID=2937369 RepID=UPI00226ADA6F
MRKVSGDLHIVDFKTKQIIASIQPEDYVDDLRHWEIKDNVDILDFKLLEDSPFLDYIQQKNLILKETNPGVITPYVITSIEKDSEAHNVTIYASGEWILLDKENYIKPQEIKSWSAEQYLTLGITGTGWEIGLIEAEGKRSFKIEKFISPLQFIQQIATLFDNIEIQYRTEIGTGKLRRFIDLVKKRGRETNKEVTLGKDLVGIKRIENSENIITALVPYYIGQDADGNDKLITIESVNNGSQYIVDDAAFQRWNVNGKHLFGFYTPESEKDELTPARLLTLAKTELKKRVSAIITYEVNSIDISSVFGYEHEDVSEGDTIRIIDEGMTPTLYLEARAIAGDDSYKDKHQNKHTFGNYVEIVNQDEALRKLYQKMLAMINDKVSKEWFAALEEKANDATKKANEAVEESQSAKDVANATKDYMEQNMVDIIEQPTAPTENLRDGKTLWIDSSDPENKMQKLWKDGQWKRVTPDTGPLQQSINDAQIEIDTLKNTVKDLPDTTWVNQQLEGKADKSGVYTKDYIDQNVVGKQVYETDKQGNTQKFSDMKTEIDRNAEAITNKAEKTQVDTLSNNLNQVTQTANTAKQTAESNTNTITSLQTIVSSLNDNVTNLLVDSGTFEGAKTTIPSATDRWWFKNNGLVRLSADTYQGNAVIETQTAWNSLAYNFKDLVSRGVVKAGDKVNYSVCVRVKNLANGQSAQQNFYFRTGATGIRPTNATNQWQRVSVSFTVTPDMMTVTGTSTDSFMRIEPDTAQTGAIWYQQSTPQLTIGEKVYTWRPAPEDNATFIKKSNEIKQTVDSNVATIQSIQKDQGTMQSTLNEVKQTTDSNSQTITTLSQTQGKQGDIIQQNTSDITQLNNQMKSKVSDTQMQEYVGGLGSTNLLFNAAFEDRVINASTGAVTNTTPSTTKWSVVGTGSGITIIPESARHHEGYNSVKITATGQTTSKWPGIMQRVPAVQNGGDYVFSAWVYVQDKNTLDNGGAIKLQFFNGANAVSTFAQTEIKDILVNNSWVLVSVKISSPNVAITHLQGDIWVRQNGTIWVSQPQLQQGSTRSTFMENPKDYANYDQLVGEIGKKVATSDFNSKVSTIETSINQQSNRIDLKAEKNDVYNKVDSDGRYGSKAIVESHTSQLSVMSNEINLRVKSGEIASAINQTAQSVLIQANKIMLDGFIEAKHLKAQELVGVTIKTAPNTENRYVKLNEQDIRLIDKNQVRGYLGFYNRASDNALQPTFILGRDASSEINGSFVINQITPIENGVEQFGKTSAYIGMASNYNPTTNTFGRSAEISLFSDGGHIQLKAQGIFKVTSNVFSSESSTYHEFKSSTGSFTFARTGLPSNLNQTTIQDDGNNADLRLAFIRLRSSHVSGYQGKLQLIPTGESTPTAGLEAGNISYTSLTNRSSRTIKANIRDLEIDSLEKIMGLKVQQYNFKSDVEKLYQMREGAVGTDKIYTTADIPLQYGLVLEDTDETFHSDLGDGINLYTLVSLNVDGTQKIKRKQDVQDERIIQLEKEIEERKLKEADQDKRITTLEELIGKLMNETPTTENTTQTEQP